MTMQERIESLKQGVMYGLANRKKNLIVELDVLAAILSLSTPSYCEHGVADGDWCERCNREYKRAATNA